MKKSITTIQTFVAYTVKLKETLNNLNRKSRIKFLMSLYYCIFRVCGLVHTAILRIMYKLCYGMDRNHSVPVYTCNWNHTSNISVFIKELWIHFQFLIQIFIGSRFSMYFYLFNTTLSISFGFTVQVNILVYRFHAMILISCRYLFFMFLVWCCWLCFIVVFNRSECCSSCSHSQYDLKQLWMFEGLSILVSLALFDHERFLQSSFQNQCPCQIEPDIFILVSLCSGELPRSSMN